MVLTLTKALNAALWEVISYIQHPTKTKNEESSVHAYIKKSMWEKAQFISCKQMSKIIRHTLLIPYQETKYLILNHKVYLQEAQGTYN